MRNTETATTKLNGVMLNISKCKILSSKPEQNFDINSYIPTKTRPFVKTHE